MTELRGWRTKRTKQDTATLARKGNNSVDLDSASTAVESSVDRQPNGRTNGRTNERTDRRGDRQADRRIRARRHQQQRPRARTDRLGLSIVLRARCAQLIWIHSYCMRLYFVLCFVLYVQLIFFSSLLCMSTSCLLLLLLLLTRSSSSSSKSPRARPQPSRNPAGHV